MMETTRDYSKFGFLETNRGITRANVERIKLSIKQWGIIPGLPILVDGDYNIIDGQHRFYAIKELGHPIPYQVINGDTIAKTMALNSVQRQWQTIDFVKSYAAQGIDAYRMLLKFHEKHSFPFSASLMLFCGIGTRMVDVKAGKNLFIVENSEEIADFIHAMDHVPYRYTKPFVIAIILLFGKSTPEQRDTIKHNILKIPQFQNHTDYITAFANIVNFRKSKNITEF